MGGSMAVDTTVFLGEYETKTLLEVESRTAGLTLVRMMVRGNSLLSSVYVRSITPGATLKINYFDTTSGTEASPERFDLNGHGLIDDTAAGETFRILVPNLHNKPLMEAIVVGGTVEFGVYASMVTTFPLSGNILDAQNAVLAADGGLPIAVYDEALGKFFLLRGSGGVLTTGSPLASPVIELATIATANIEQSHTFPAGTRRFMLKARGPSKLKLSHTSGGAYMTIWPGAFYCSPESMPVARTIYFQSPVAGLEIEMESWS